VGGGGDAKKKSSAGSRPKRGHREEWYGGEKKRNRGGRIRPLEVKGKRKKPTETKSPFLRREHAPGLARAKGTPSAAREELGEKILPF